jgi:RNA 2',3'-cyclic 3'-phosphodiesterase
MRLFVALDLPDSVRRELADLIIKLKPLCTHARWARPEGLHVALKFIGHVIDAEDKQKLDELRSSLATVRVEFPVDMSFHGVGFFSDEHRPRVFWCGVKSSTKLTELAATVQRALEPLGIPRDDHAFVPHLTLARFKSPLVAKTPGPRAPHAEFFRATAEMAQHDFGSVRESQFHLYERLLKPSGPEYKKIGTFSFVKDGA